MTVRELVRYGAKGAIATVANVGLMSILVEVGHLEPTAAAIISTAALLLVGYIAMNHFVFPDAERPSGARAHVSRGAKYYTVIFAGKGVNYAVFVGLVSAGVWYPLSWIIGSGSVFLGTYSANRLLWKGDIA